MEKVNILYKPDVEEFLFHLVFVLFKEDYFSYLENAEVYKDNIIDFVENNIKNFPSKKTPIPLNNFGSNYIFYNSNSRTTWYVFFEQKGTNYLITNILNNHCEEAKWL
ncbi:hypothetical protein [Flavobacterium sp.]|jgi:hypothetical protein|uniref:hypothetical protein n=1 Tax=Flavobacterium sp. TaxID=239 RepID=UPI0037BEF63C